ncbi:hypothetical protein [Mesorhizobium marinum]|uniref:Uncharacterized protein n=1 Tax=Mesorhizobium marinum TaxID=3228790 RepID=A0ABV3R417_9HYPH
MTGLAFNTDRKPSCDELVSVVLSGHPLGEPISTSRVILEFRKADPGRLEPDEEIVASIVRIATGRTMFVAFDHREHADRSDHLPERPNIHR